MTWWAVGITAVTAVVSSVSASNQAQAQSKQDQATANSNASQSIANMQAVEAQASAQEVQVRDQNQQYLGRQRAAMADSGTGSLSSGSNFDVARQSAYAAEIDALNTRYAGELRGSQYLQSAYDYKAGANAAGAHAAQLASTQYIGAGVAALSAGSSAYARGTKARTNLSAAGYSTASGSL
jgi:hypothetical protein